MRRPSLGSSLSIVRATAVGPIGAAAYLSFVRLVGRLLTTPGHRSLADRARDPIDQRPRHRFNIGMMHSVENLVN